MFDVEHLLRLWNEPVPAGAAAVAAFGAVYADPVVVNGAPVTVARLVELARGVQAAYPAAERTLVDLVRGGDKVAFAFLLRAVDDGRPVEVRVVDILTITDGRVSSVWAASEPVVTA